MAEETHYTANTGIATISTGNTNLDGTGAMGNLITGASNGTLIKSIFIKATDRTSSGMVRIFVQDAIATRLLLEVPVPAVRPSSNTPSFETQIILNMTLKSGYGLKVSTQNGEPFNVICEAMDWSYYTTSVRPDTTQLLVSIDQSQISTANSNLDGTGAMGAIFRAANGPTYKGASVRSISIKSVEPVTTGMIRLFIDNGSNKYLFTEIPVKTETNSGVDEAFDRTVIFEDDLDIQAGFGISASTEIGEAFNVIGEGTDWNYAL